MSADTRRVLIVDDDHEITTPLITLLRMAGYEVEMAFDGLSAIETAEAFGPDICLVDVNVPRLNVYELARSFRERLDRLPLLGNVTPFSERGDSDPDAEFDLDFSKPSDPFHVVEQLSNFLRLDSADTIKKARSIVSRIKPRRPTYRVA